MKTCICKSTQIAVMLGSASLVLNANPLLASDKNSGSYLSTDVGLNLMDDLSDTRVSISLNPGVRWDFSTGYAFKLSDQLTLAPELGVGIIYNSLKDASIGPVNISTSGSYVQVPVMGNLTLNWQFIPKWVAYAGGGAGLDNSFLDITDVGGRGSGGNSNESDFAWQGIAGIRYQFNSSELGLGFRYLAVKPSGLQTIGNTAIMASYTFHF